MENCLEVEQVIDSKEFESIFTIAYAHGFMYQGPYINRERLKQVILAVRQN